MKLKITEQEFIDAVAGAGPRDGQPWDAMAVAEHLAALVEREWQEELERKRHFERALEAIDCQFVPSGLAPVDTDATRSWQEVARAVHAGHVRERIERNRALVAGFATSLGALATAGITGGVSAPGVVTLFLPIASQIAAALNES